MDLGGLGLDFSPSNLFAGFAFGVFGWYIFKWTGEGFAKQVVDFGPIGGGHGLGICFAVADLTGDGRLDVVAPGKEGLAIYFNEGEGIVEVPSIKPEP